MNREIKFRAWDKYKNKIYNIGDIALWIGNKPLSVGNLLDWFEDENLMQYTGLKDKNGKEIYEGDIVRTNDKSSIADIEIGEIYFSEYGLWAIKNNEEDEVAIESYTWVGDGTSRKKNCGFEVIGNIFENSELLK